MSDTSCEPKALRCQTPVANQTAMLRCQTPVENQMMMRGVRHQLRTNGYAWCQTPENQTAMRGVRHQRTRRSGGGPQMTTKRRGVGAERR
ncbi:MAG: hypothetical protein LBG05_09595, partial [Treponema sp.]|nr:hypothetical protein [Treponema sp.]